MLTKVAIRNFKKFDEAEIDLDDAVVFVGPNNSGKTAAMQALALWSLGVKRWNEKRGSGSVAKERRGARNRGVTINRLDLLSIPHPSASLLWKDRRTRNLTRENGSQRTSNVRIDVMVEGVEHGCGRWECGLEFDFANQESLYCRPLRTEETPRPGRMDVPAQAGAVNVAFLPPMSGLASTEVRLETGAINVLLGEGRSAEVIRNLCFRIWERNRNDWDDLVGKMSRLFGAELLPPRYIAQRGELEMDFVENGVTLDISSSGRGMQQTLLLLSFLYGNDGAVILLDEPDAHLEILRQRQIYATLVEVAQARGNQVIAASHSEVLLNEAAGRDLVVAFVEKPHPIGDRRSQSYKSLASIGFDDYLQAERSGWILYLEGSTDLAILREMAARLGHEDAQAALECAFVTYVGNLPKKAEDHFLGLREAVPNLQGVALFDRLGDDPPVNEILKHLVWKRRGIENYICSAATLEEFSRTDGLHDDEESLLKLSEQEGRLSSMREAIAEVSDALETLKAEDPWGDDVKASEEVLDPIFRRYYDKLGIPNLMEKKSFHMLAKYVPQDEISPEISEKLDAIASTAARARESFG